MVSFEQAAKLAVSFDPHNDMFREYENVYEFYRGSGPETTGPQPCVIVKETGERLFWSDVLSGDYDYGRLISGGKIPAE